MAALGLARFFAEVSQNIRHANTAPENGVSLTKVKGTHWNAAHLAPDLEMGGMAGLSIQEVSAGTNEVYLAPENRWQKRLAQGAAIRVQACVVEACPGTSLLLQYTTDLTGAGGWTTTGVSVSVASTGNVVSSFVAAPAPAIAAAAGCLFRWVTVQ